MFFDLAAETWGEEERQAVQNILESGQFTMGPNVKEFERRFADYHGRRFAVMTNSGSSANLIATAAQFHKNDRPLKAGDEVIVPAISWSTTYHPLHQHGLSMRIVDVEIESLNMDVRFLEEALTPKTRMLMAVSILGNPAALDVMREFCDQHDLILMEDNCESLDAELNGKKTGCFGDVSTFSFFFSHHISTMEGGMVLTDDEETYHLLLCLRNHGWTRDIPEDSPIYKQRPNDRFESYRFILPGYNVRPIEMSGAVGIEQLKKLPVMTEGRRKNLELFNDLFAGDERFFTQRENGRSSSFCFPIVLNPAFNIDKDVVFSALANADIGYRIITGGCVTRHDVADLYDYTTVGNLDAANLVHDNGFFVGNHPYDLSPQINTLYEVLDKTCV